MSIQSRAFSFLRSTPLRYYYHLLKARMGGAPQSDESTILSKLAVDCPRSFVEFGFHPTEYNCIALADFDGLLVDGDETTVRLAKAILPRRIEARQSFITLENISSLGSHFANLGVLSIDVDGNDYWFLKALLPSRPGITAHRSPRLRTSARRTATNSSRSLPQAGISSSYLKPQVCQGWTLLKHTERVPSGTSGPAQRQRASGSGSTTCRLSMPRPNESNAMHSGMPLRFTIYVIGEMRRIVQTDLQNYAA